MQEKTARESLLSILNILENNTLNNALEQIFSQTEYSHQEKAYITNVAHQVLRYKLRFEALIRLYCHKTDALTNNAKNILLLALCEMYCMQSIPLHASVNEAVNLAKKHAKSEVALINGVLRKIDNVFPHKELDKKLFMKEIKFLYPKKTLLELDACYESLPSFILDILRKQYGKEYASNYLQNLNAIPWYSYRFNPLKSNWKEEQAYIAEHSSMGKNIGLTGYSSPTRHQKMTELYETGAVSYQGASSQIAIEKILPYIQENQCSIWDACCGVGGKSLALAEQGVQILCASDTNKKRLDVYTKECTRLGIPAISTQQISLQEAYMQNIPCILLDAPCSGLGTLTANPDLRYKINKKGLKEVILLQEELLESAVSKLAPKGLLCYLTCSLNKAENEEQIEKIQEKTQITCLLSEYILPSVCGADTIYLAILQK